MTATTHDLWPDDRVGPFVRDRHARQEGGLRFALDPRCTKCISEPVLTTPDGFIHDYADTCVDRGCVPVNEFPYVEVLGWGEAVR